MIDRERLDGNHIEHADGRLHAMNSQRTSSQSAQLCRSGRISLDQTAGDEHEQSDAQHDPVNGKGRETADAHPANKPRDDA